MELSSRAAELHRRAIVIDGHGDILMALADGRMRLADRVEIPDPEGWEPPPELEADARHPRFPPHTEYFGTMGRYANDDFELVTTVADIQAVKQAGSIGGLLALEGLEPLAGDLRLLDLYHRMGLRMASLTHSRRNLFGDGFCRDVKTGGLTREGRRAVQRMNELGIVIDLAHISQAGFWEILELTTVPVVMSHREGRRYFPPPDRGDGAPGP